MLWRVIIFSIALISIAESQLIYDCPSDWVSFLQEQRCYKFISSPAATYENAVVQCAEYGAYIIAVNTPQENLFIASWLTEQDALRHSWFTSGIATTASGSGYRWESDQTDVGLDMQYWNAGVDRNKGNRIIYSYNRQSYGWSYAFGNETLAFICEISQQDAYAINTQKRTHYYGVPPSEKDNIKYGPKFMLEPTDVVTIDTTPALFLEAIASGNSPATYKWFKGENLDQEVLSSADSRITLTNGKLSIQEPNQMDENQYRCTAENEFGKIISTIARITFGKLDQFSNVEDEAVRPLAFEGAQMECSKITFTPSVVYNWQRVLSSSSKTQYIYTTLTPYIFISSNGKLYFTEVTSDDNGEYYCQVTLHGIEGNAEGSSQPPSRTSKPIRLEVINQAAKTDWGPIIQNDFIAVFPNPPIRGQSVRMECFAYGSAANYQDIWSYTWIRRDGFMPERAVMYDLNRVLIIDNVQLEDQGTYECLVRRGQSSSDSKTINLVLESKPYFLIPLEDQHLDIGSSLSWRCLAGGNPKPVYSWYKNGVELLSSDDIQINTNILTINNADATKHNGMYQCTATNFHGTGLSTGQIRVLAFKPTFIKNPLPQSLDAALSGNATIPCQPEAAPAATIVWRKNNVNLNAPMDSSSRVRMLPNGFLFITNVNYGDQGLYECSATNNLGKDSSFCQLFVKSGTVISLRPSPLTIVQQNNTALIRCEASYDPGLDLIYNWEFNGAMIDIETDPHFVVSTTLTKGLIVRMAQFYHEGDYTCIARTPLNEARATGRLEVTGPPGPPIGLFTDVATVTQTTVKLYWFDGDTHGYPIIYYVVEYAFFEAPDLWITPAENTFFATQTIVTSSQRTDLRAYVIQNLYPYNSYRFRLKAVNVQGVGVPSIPSTYVQTKQDKPVTYPSNLHGNTVNAKVGDLVFNWNKLPQKFHGGPTTKYKIHWRVLSSDPYALWTHAVIEDWETEKFVTQVGVENYYLAYEAKIQAFNDDGSSANSSIAIAYSAMGMPIAAPEKVRADGFNSTACEVYWSRIPDNREAMLGRVGGYQVNYWLKDDTSDNPYKQSIRFEGNVDRGTVIGLWPDTYYNFEVQVYNDAGLGPRSEVYFAETYNEAPILYPQELRVFSFSYDKVKLSWRGVSTGTSEDTLKGYKIYVWQANENYRSAKEIEVEKFPTEYILDGIEVGFVYAVRVAGYSNGGDGSKSPTVYFAMNRSNVLYDRTVTSILAISSREYASCLLITVCLLVSRLAMRKH